MKQGLLLRNLRGGLNYFFWGKKKIILNTTKNPSFPAAFYPSKLSAGWVDGSSTDIRLEWVRNWLIIQFTLA